MRRALAVLGSGLLVGCAGQDRVVGVPAHAEPWTREIGRSVEGRPIRVLRIGRGPRRVLLVGSIHGNEREGRVVTERLASAARAEPGLLDRITLEIVEDLNPDGSAAGTRFNAAGVDLNRSFPAASFRPGPRSGPRPLSQPESRALRDLVRRRPPDLVMVCHSAGDGPYVNWDGPARSLAGRFARLSGLRIVPSRKLHATPGSLGSWIGIDLGIPILTIEFRRGMDPAEAWRRTRRAFLAVLGSQP